MFTATWCRSKGREHEPRIWGFESTPDVMWIMLRSGSGEATSADFDGGKVSVCGAGFAHGDASERVAKLWMGDVV